MGATEFGLIVLFLVHEDNGVKASVMDGVAMSSKQNVQCAILV